MKLRRPVVIGMDPGLTGAIVVILDGYPEVISDIPTISRKTPKRIVSDVDPRKVKAFLAMIDKSYEIVKVCLENVHSMPGQGVSSSFRFGRGFGVLETAGCDWSLEYVTPSKWKEHHGLIKSAKDDARLLAIEKWPDAHDQFKRKKDIGRADAALIGLYGYESGREDGQLEGSRIVGKGK